MPKAKLTTQKAREIRLAKKSRTCRQLAADYGVSSSTINRICNEYAYREFWMPRKYQKREAVKTAMNCENPTCGKRFVYWQRPADSERHYCSRRCGLLMANQPKKKLPDNETLARLYHFRGWSLQRIAMHYGCCFQAVHYAMQRANIKRRSQSRLVTWDGKTQTMTEWAKEQNINLQTVYSRLNSGQNAVDALRLAVVTSASDATMLPV